MHRLAVCLLVSAIATIACSSGSDSTSTATTPELATTARTVPPSTAARDITECTDALAAFLVPGRAVEAAFIDYDQSGSAASEVPIDSTLKARMVDAAVALQRACEDTGIVNFPPDITPSDFLAKIADGHFEADDGRQLVVFIGEVEHPRLG